MSPSSRSAGPWGTSSRSRFSRRSGSSRPTAGAGNVLYIHVTLVPYIKTAGEMKTKPTQHSVKELREIGIQPDILLCRCERDLPRDMKAKIALFCNVEEKAVITAADVEHIYAVPLAYHREGLDEQVVEKLNIWTKAPDLTPWQEVVDKLMHPSRGEVQIAIVGKYVNLTESYKSLAEALTHGGIANDCRVFLKYLDSEKIEDGGDRRAPGRGGRHPRPGRFRRAGDRREDQGDRICPDPKDPVLRHLPRHADGGRGICAQRLRA